MKLGEIVVITGPPGAGKSTTSASLVMTASLGVLVDGDAYFTAVKSGWIPPRLAESHKQNEAVIDALGASTAAYARGGYATVVEGIIGPWFLERFREPCRDIPMHYVVIRPNRDAAFARASLPAGRHNDPLDLTSMYDAFAALGVYERHVIDNSIQTPPETLAAVASGLADGRFRI